MTIKTVKRIEYPEFGLGAEWPPITPIRDDTTAYDVINITNIIDQTTTDETPEPDADVYLVGSPKFWDEGINSSATQPTSQAWPTANVALYIPFRVDESYLVKQLLSFNGATASGNIDVGIYTITGTRLVSSGSTAHAGTDTLQVFDIADLALAAGNYYWAIAMDNTTAAIYHYSTASFYPQVSGILRQTTAFPLPSTATFALPPAGIGRIPTGGFTTLTNL